MATTTQSREAGQTWSFRGSKSRNKVSVGEPAEGSLQKSAGARGWSQTARDPPHSPSLNPFLCTNAVASAGLPHAPPRPRSSRLGGDTGRRGRAGLPARASRGLDRARRRTPFETRESASRDAHCQEDSGHAPGVESKMRNLNQAKTFNNGSLGSGIDEERSEMR